MKHKSKRVNPRHRKLIDALTKLGHTNVRVWWEPLGPSFEMCGPSGGYFFKSDQGFEPIGWSFEMAMEQAQRCTP